MEQYKLFNLNDPNVSEILESNTEFEASLEALEKLGWGISKKDVPIYEDDEEIYENDYDDDQDVVGKYGD